MAPGAPTLVTSPVSSRELYASNNFFLLPLAPQSLFTLLQLYSLVDIPNIWENLKSQLTLTFKEYTSLSLKGKVEETNLDLALTMYQGLCRML